MMDLAGIIGEGHTIILIKIGNVIIIIIDFENGWVGVGLGLKQDDIDRLITILKIFKDNHDSHFNLMSNFEGEKSVGDMEF
ncbi:hypothetical protein [Marinobacterium arenosum]|uniref:hypothetical protein n=1 Tax=Marinobacterium arenosum TaxID=2862496 RepID=UPI001C986F65|nr:hypothetical protein [Marinobacterium arenosum]MBY4678780.1 hypothetical protein [Marinobacterium arenosum]